MKKDHEKTPMSDQDAADEFLKGKIPGIAGVETNYDVLLLEHIDAFCPKCRAPLLKEDQRNWICRECDETIIEVGDMVELDWDYFKKYRVEEAKNSNMEIVSFIHVMDRNKDSIGHVTSITERVVITVKFPSGDTVEVDPEWIKSVNRGTGETGFEHLGAARRFKVGDRVRLSLEYPEDWSMGKYRGQIATVVGLTGEETYFIDFGDGAHPSGWAITDNQLEPTDPISKSEETGFEHLGTEPALKVGDRVRIIADVYPEVTGKVGVISEFHAAKVAQYVVSVNNRSYWFRDYELMPVDKQETGFEHLGAESKFKVGDKVRLDPARSPAMSLRGPGEIVKVEELGYYVSFSDDLGPMFFNENELTLLETGFEHLSAPNAECYIGKILFYYEPPIIAAPYFYVYAIHPWMTNSFVAYQGRSVAEVEKVRVAMPPATAADLSFGEIKTKGAHLGFSALQWTEIKYDTASSYMRPVDVADYEETGFEHLGSSSVRGGGRGRDEEPQFRARRSHQDSSADISLNAPYETGFEHLGVEQELNVGDRVVYIGTTYRGFDKKTGVILEVPRDDTTKFNEWYTVDFGLGKPTRIHEVNLKKISSSVEETGFEHLCAEESWRDLKVGDRVFYVGNTTPSLRGAPGIVRSLPLDHHTEKWFGVEFPGISHSRYSILGSNLVKISPEETGFEHLGSETMLDKKDYAEALKGEHWAIKDYKGMIVKAETKEEIKVLTHIKEEEEHHVVELHELMDTRGFEHKGAPVSSELAGIGAFITIGLIIWGLSTIRTK
jgi:hypothetical protein